MTPLLLKQPPITLFTFSYSDILTVPQNGQCGPTSEPFHSLFSLFGIFFLHILAQIAPSHHLLSKAYPNHPT